MGIKTEVLRNMLIKEQNVYKVMVEEELDYNMIVREKQDSLNLMADGSLDHTDEDFDDTYRTIITYLECLMELHVDMRNSFERINT